MSRYTPQNLTTGFQNTVINENQQNIKTAIDDTLSRKAGDTPNAMETNLDMGSHKVINVTDPTDAHDAVNKGYGDTNYGGGSVIQSAASAAAAASSASSASSSASAASSSASAASASASSASSSASAASTSEANALASANSLNIRTISDQAGTYAVTAPGDRNKVIRYTGAGGHTHTLPTLASAGSQFEILFLNDGSGNLTIDGNGAEQIQGSASITLAPLGFVTLVANASSWSITSTRKYDSALSNVVEDLTPQLGGTLDANSFAINEAKGADIASAATTDIGAAAGNFVHVTGTTTITALGTVAAGTRRTVEFTGALTLTHNATSLILPTGANITTAAGDMAVFVSEGSGNWRCVSYSPADGLPKATVTVPKGGTGNTSATAYAIQCGGTTSTNPLQSIASVGTAGQVLTSGGAGALPSFTNQGRLTFLSTATASNVATVDITIPSGYTDYVIVGSNITAATDAVALWARVDVGGGYLSGASDYQHLSIELNIAYNVSSAAAQMVLTAASLGNAAGEVAHFYMYGHKLKTTNARKAFHHFTHYNNTTTSVAGTLGGSAYIGATTEISGVRIMTSSGNISGTFTLYGVL